MVSELGQGGTAHVYLAIADGPSGFQKLVVLKVLKKNLCDDHELRAMFLSEAKLAARLRHPNIVQTFDVLELGGLPTLVMEYLEGQSLSQVIMRGADDGFTLAMYLRVLADGLRGLHAAHELTDFDGAPLGVVHRDVSPQNLFVTVDGQAKVLDFGIAKLAGEMAAVETAVGTIKGKLRYMAPEQIACGGAKRVDRRADIFAAGVILWEALAGRRMWKGTGEEEIKTRVVAGDLPGLDFSWAERRGIAQATPLAQICTRALSLRPDDRFATAAELADRLEENLPHVGPLVSPRQIGATVARLFQDRGAEIRDAIGRRMSTGAIVGTGRNPGFTEHMGTEEHMSVIAGTAVQSPRWRVRWLALALTVLALGSSAAGVFSRAGRTRGLDELAGGDRSSGPEPPPPRKLSMDELLTAANASSPVIASALVTGQNRPPIGRSISNSFRKSASKHMPRPPSAVRPSGLPPPITAPVAGDVPGSRYECDHPFFVDSDGIKKFRPECR